MSVEGGTMSAGISGTASIGASAGVSAPSFSSEGFSAHSPSSFESFSNTSLSSPSINGGSVFEGISGGNLFSETSPFVPSISVVPEMPVSKSVDIFSSDFEDIGSQASKLDIVGFKEISPTQPVSEKQVLGINLEEFTVVARPVLEEITQVSDLLKTKISTPKLDIPGFSEFTPQADPITEKAVLGFDLEEFKIIAQSARDDVQKPSDLSESQGEDVQEVQAFKVEPEEHLNIQPDQNQAKIAAELFVSTGLYTKPEAKAVVDEILNNNIEQEAKAIEIEPKVPAKTQAQEIAKVALILKELEDLQEEAEEEEKKKKKTNSKSPSFEVDQRAQLHRKATLMDRINQLFTHARIKNADIVYGKDVVSKIEEKAQHKSQFLLVKGWADAPDGSFHDALDGVSKYHSADTSIASQVIMGAIASNLIDANPAVKITGEAPKDPVTESDVKRVVKYVNVPISTSI